jgi:hypothetical protein
MNEEFIYRKYTIFLSSKIRKLYIYKCECIMIFIEKKIDIYH